jgi:carboxypeptidase D
MIAVTQQRLLTLIPEFAYYFEAQNAAISKGQLKDATPIDLIALGINNGWYDAIIQEREFIDFSRNNSYYPLINDTIYTEYMQAYETGCLPGLENCTSTTGEVPQCFSAHEACGNVDNAFSVYYPNIDYYDIRQSNLSLYPPETYAKYLSDPAVMKAIGAKSTYVECSNPVDAPFAATGDGTFPLYPNRYASLTQGRRSLIFADALLGRAVRHHHPHLGR